MIRADKNKVTKYVKWMNDVEKIIVGKIGVSAADLTDWGFRDAFDNEMSPCQLADKLLKDNGLCGDS